MTRSLGVTPITKLAVAAAVAILIGCGSETASTEKATKTGAAPAREAAATVPDALVGTWVGRLGSPTNNSEYSPGRYTMKISADGTTDVFQPAADVAEPCLTQKPCNSHAIEASGPGRLMIGATYTCLAPGEYSYKIEGDRLTTKRVKDECFGDRPHLYDGTVWRRQSS